MLFPYKVVRDVFMSGRYQDAQVKEDKPWDGILTPPRGDGLIHMSIFNEESNINLEVRKK